MKGNGAMLEFFEQAHTTWWQPDGQFSDNWCAIS